MALKEATIRLNGQTYRLARQDVVNKALGGTARRWEMTRKAVTTQRERRSNVIQTETPGEYVIVYDDWSQGLTGDHQPEPGKVVLGENVDLTTPGALRSIGQYISVGSTGTSKETGNVVVVRFNNIIYIAWSRLLVKIVNGATAAVKDFGAGINVSDAIVWNNTLVFGFGGSSNKIQVMTTGEGWSTATDAVYADYFVIVENRLWRATATNQVSNIVAGADPKVLTNWSSGITIGDTLPITDLNAYGERLAVSLTNGLYLGDAAAIFPNVLESKGQGNFPDNGKNTYVLGATIYYPHLHGLLEYNQGVTREIGIEQELVQGERADQLPGTHIRCVVHDGQDLWAACEPSFYPQVKPTAVFYTTDDGANFTNQTSALTDNDLTTTAAAVLGAPSPWTAIGYTSSFSALLAIVAVANGTTTAIDVQYWNGSAWASFTNLAQYCRVVDNTAKVASPFTLSGWMYWHYRASGWVTTSLPAGLTVGLYYIRLYGASVAGTTLSEIRLCTGYPTFYVYRRHLTERGNYAWQPFFATPGVTPGNYGGTPRAIGIVPADAGSYHYGNSLLVVGDEHGWLWPLPNRTWQFPLDRAPSSGKVVQPKDSGGMPQVNKQWLSVSAKGRQIDANHTVNISYRTNENTAGTDVWAALATSPATATLSGVTGYDFQLFIYLSATAAATDVPTELNQIEVRFRELPTWKRQYKAILELTENMTATRGTKMPSPAVQLTNLETALGAGPVTLLAPEGTAYTVTVDSVDVVELAQAGIDYPALLVQVGLTQT